MVLTESAKKLKAGDGAPHFNLKGIDGKMHSSDEFANSKAVLIIFMCNHCPYVKAKLNSVIGLYEKFKDKKVSVVGINSNDPDYPEEGFENMKRFAAEWGINFP